MKALLRGTVVALAVTLPALAVSISGPAGATGEAPQVAKAAAVHKLAIHVDENDPARMNMALNNAQNARAYYESRGEKVIIEIVAYGPGLTMFRKDSSPVADRIGMMAMEDPDMAFSACGNTHAAMSRKAGKEVELLPEAKIVPSGVVRLMELQEEGYAYIRP